MPKMLFLHADFFVGCIVLELEFGDGDTIFMSLDG